MAVENKRFDKITDLRISRLRLSMTCLNGGILDFNLARILF